MRYHKQILSLAIAASLVACGSGDNSSSNYIKPDPVAVNESNISQAIKIQNSVPVQINIPENLESTSLTSVEQVIVSANSSFSLNISTPNTDGKTVAGYLIEFPDGSQQFIRSEQSLEAIANSQGTDGIQSRSLSLKPSSTKPKMRALTTPRVLSETPRSEETTLVVTGWNNGNFSLDQSLENLAIRILPLLVNDNIANIAELSFEQILVADGFDMSMVQELILAVEAVATSTVQISLTWDTETDIDLYVLEPGFAETEVQAETEVEIVESENYYDGFSPYQNVISYFNRISKKSLGWLDRDNIDAYGPENITFNYQMPQGDYKIAVNYYNGSPETNYTVTITIGENDPVVVNGKFNENTSNAGNLNDEDGTDIVHTFTVDSNLNSQLSPKIPLSQYIGVWQLPADSTMQGYIKIEADGISIYDSWEDNDTSSCTFYSKHELDFLPTGFRVDGNLEVSDAFIYSFENNFSYSYRTLMKVNESAITDCISANIEESLAL